MTEAAAYTDRMIKAGAATGFTPASSDEVGDGRAIAAQLMGHDVAPLATILDIQAMQPASSLVWRASGKVAGLVATLLLIPSAEPTLANGDFDGLAPRDELLARPGDAVGFYYIWGIAGATKEASAAVMELSRRLRFDALADLTAYAVAATPAGRRAGVNQLGFRPVRGPDDSLVVSPAIKERWAA